MNNESYSPIENQKYIIRSPVIKPSHLQNKFSIFMKRKETISKINSDLHKKNSNHSNDSSLSKKPNKRREERRIMSLKENRTDLFARLLAQIQPKNKRIRSQIREEIYKDLRQRSRKNSGKSTKKTSKDRVTLKLQPIENNPIKKFSIDSAEEINLITTTPVYLRERINLEEELNKLSSISKEIKALIEEIEVDEETLKQEQDKFSKFTQELKLTREFRNEMIAEVHRMKNEIDVMKSIRNSIKSSSEKDKSITEDKSMFSSLSGNAASSNRKCETSFDVIIDDLENKLSSMKLENYKFLESYDLLTTEYKGNEDKNKALRLNIANVDETIKGLNKERRGLKAGTK